MSEYTWRGDRPRIEGVVKASNAPIGSIITKTGPEFRVNRKGQYIYNDLAVRPYMKISETEAVLVDSVDKRTARPVTLQDLEGPWDDSEMISHMWFTDLEQIYNAAEAQGINRAEALRRELNRRRRNRASNNQYPMGRLPRLKVRINPNFMVNIHS